MSKNNNTYLLVAWCGVVVDFSRKKCSEVKHRPLPLVPERTTRVLYSHKSSPYIPDTYTQVF